VDIVGTTDDDDKEEEEEESSTSTGKSGKETDSGLSPLLPLPGSSKVKVTAEEKQMELLMDRQEEITSYDIEGQLYEAIRKQDFATAAVQQKALQQLQYDATIQVLQCNSAFYKAFSKKDYKAMELLWLPNDKHVLCIHPSHTPIVSSYNINQSWKQMFTSSSSSNFQKTWIEPTNIRINVRGNNMAVVTCDEQVYIRRFVRGQKRQSELINTLMATNIYYKLHQRWYMIHHHASWHPNSEAAKAALSRSSTTSSTSSSPSSAYIASLKKRQEALDAQKNGSNNSDGMDGILGMKGVGPLLGDLKPKKLLSPGSQQQQNPPPQRRIVMGSLSDILNGSLEDLLNGAGGSKSSDKKGNDDKDEGSAIIQFHRIESDDDDDDDDDDDIELELDDEDDDDEDDEEIEITSKHSRINGKKEAISMIHEWATRRGNDDDTVNSDLRSNSSTAKKQSDDDTTTIKRQQQQCLKLIRQLCSEGLISQQHKRTLITDMIQTSASSSSGNSESRKSQIELAYEFLFADGDDTDDSNDDTMYDIAREEFADQCRIIAESLSSPS
jgi:ketosteroid isomerase-like protein